MSLFTLAAVLAITVQDKNIIKLLIQNIFWCWEISACVTYEEWTFGDLLTSILPVRLMPQVLCLPSW